MFTHSLFRSILIGIFFCCFLRYSINCTDRPIKVIKDNARHLTRLYISLRGIGHLNGTYYDLNELCKMKQFQSLELQFTGTTGVQYLMRHSKILAMMERLHTIHLTDMVLSKDVASAITMLTRLKRLNFVSTTLLTGCAELLAKELPNLEEIYSDVLNDFTLFICYAPRLKMIELANTEMAELNLGWGLVWLNEERSKLHNTCPITIYIKQISAADTEHSVITSGLITIKPIAQDKRILLKVKNTFLNL